MSLKMENVGSMAIPFLTKNPTVQLLFMRMCLYSQDYRDGVHGGGYNPAVCSLSRSTMAALTYGDRKKTKNLDRPIRELKNLGLIQPLHGEVDAKPGFGRRQEFRILLPELLANNEVLVNQIKALHPRSPHLKELDELVQRGREGKGM